MRMYIVILLILAMPVCSDTLSSHAYGNLRIGMKVGDALNYLHGYIAGSPAQKTIESIDCYYLIPSEKPKDVDIMVINERIVRFDFNNKSNVKTDKGIGIGTARSQVMSAYPKVVITEHPYLGSAGSYLSVGFDNDNGLIFETNAGSVISFRLGSKETIGLIEGCM